MHMYMYMCMQSACRAEDGSDKRGTTTMGTRSASRGADRGSKVKSASKHVIIDYYTSRVTHVGMPLDAWTCGGRRHVRDGIDMEAYCVTHIVTTNLR